MHASLLKSLLFVAILNVPGVGLTTLAQPVRKATPQPRQPLTAPIPFDRAVKVGKLPNGLTYYIRKNAEPANRAELRLVVRAGSVLENDNQQGLAH